MRRRIMLAAALLFAPVLFGARCSVTGASGEIDDLREARRRWASAGVEDYTFVLQRSCFCAGGVEPVRIVVRDGAAVSYTVVQSGEPLQEESRQWYPTIDGLFEVLEDALEDADEVVASYDAARGYPIQVDIDYVERAVDDEIGYTISGFAVN